MDYVSDIILEMRDRDHIVFTYNNESQFKEIVNAYVRRGIDRNQINVLIIYTKEQQKFIESIDRIENVNLIFNSQDIMIIEVCLSWQPKSVFVFIICVLPIPTVSHLM